MGNNPSTSKSSAGSPAGSTHGATAGSSARREPKLRDNLQSHRVAAPPEPSLAQARGTNVNQHRRDSPTSHSPFGGQSPSPKEQIGSYQSKSSESGKPDHKNEPSKPVAVPIPLNASNSLDTSSIKSPTSASQIEPSGPPTDSMSYHLARPPRLPLPIEEEVHTPGSPILAPKTADSSIEGLEDLDRLPRHTSNLSNTTADEDEDAELPIDKTKPVVPTEIFWYGGGDKVYVTGTIFQWSRKSKLHPIKDQPGHFSATIHVRPGTHHVRFIIDGNMTTSKDLPTTVDFGNNLVNYIEVSADDVLHDVPISTESMGTSTGRDDKNLLAPAQEVEEEVPAVPVPKKKLIDPTVRYSTIIPQYLLDLDKAEDSQAYQYAAAAIEKLPTPPSLPGFLGKPILNAATPMKDDNSVLNMPNHTVLNHLATSSIKQNVLAVSATTRYKRKYVTTIMYKPTGDD